MASNFRTLDTELPEYRAGEPVQKQVRLLYDGLLRMKQDLRYVLGNLMEENWNAAERKRLEKKLERRITKQLAPLEKRIADIEKALEGGA